MKRTKSKTLASRTAEIAQHTPEEIEALLAELNNKLSIQTKLYADMDAECTVIRQQYAPQLDVIGPRIVEIHETVKLWAEANRDKYFTKKKYLGFLHGVIGFRKGNPKLKPLSKWTWKKVLDVIKALPAMKDYLRIPEPEVNRETILADRESLGAEGLAAIGLKVHQDESFYIESNKTEPVSIPADPTQKAA